MTPFMSLLLPIALSAVAVFILSSIIHMAMPWHKSDYTRVPDEDGVMAALRPFGIPPGDYLLPSPMTPGGMKSPDYMAKHAAGPAVIMTVIPPGPWNMGKLMGTWFVFTLVVAAIVGCVTGAVVPPGGDDHTVFHLALVLTFLCYVMGAVPLSIWYHRKWSTAFKNAIDGLIYGLATAFIFAWMWPKI